MCRSNKKQKEHKKNSELGMLSALGVCIQIKVIVRGKYIHYTLRKP